MGKTVLYMSVSVDGFIAGPNEGPGNGLGDGGHRLHEWFLTSTGAGHRGAADHLTGVNREVMDEVMATGAVVVGRRTFELAGGWGGDHHDGVPIFVLTRHQPGTRMPWPAVTYVSDVKRAMELAKETAGEKDVLVHGAATAQLALAAGRKGDAMTDPSTSPALATALAYHQAWTSQNLGQAMSYIADDITCDAPGARISGAQQYRDFPGGFMARLTGVETAAAIGDDTTAVLFYYPHTANVSDAPTAECLTVTSGKITRSVLVFDRPSFAPPQR